MLSVSITGIIATHKDIFTSDLAKERDADRGILWFFIGLLLLYIGDKINYRLLGQPDTE
jgi:hypothetical protein